MFRKTENGTYICAECGTRLREQQGEARTDQAAHVLFFPKCQRVRGERKAADVQWQAGGA